MKPRKNGRLTVQNRLGDSFSNHICGMAKRGHDDTQYSLDILKADLSLNSYGPFNAGFLVMRLECPDSVQ